jgi:RNA polymerase sigma-70 factor (ECF subfamily)
VASDELAFAAACVAADATAVARFERDYVPELHATLARLGLPPGDAEDAVRVLCADLLRGPKPRLLEYRGRGSLRAWLRAVTARAGLRLRRPSAASLTVELAATAQPGAADTATDATDALSAEHRDVFGAAFAAAVAALPETARLLLKQRHRHRVGIPELAQLHGVSQDAIERKLADARAQLAAATQAEMRSRLGAAPVEPVALDRLIAARLDTSLSALSSGVRPAT